MKVIILTGTIGSGKSTASTILRELGAKVIDSDSLAKEVLNPGTRGWQEVVKAFGQEILDPDESINRKKLAGIVFRNPEKLQKLNRIVHPKVDEEVEARLQEYRQQGLKAAFIEMAILVGASWMQQVEEVWVVKIPRELALKRLRGRGVSESEALARLSAQSPPEEKVKADGVRLRIINNDGSPDDLRRKIIELWQEI